MKVLITAPSLDEKRNVSGISTAVRQIVEHGSQKFSHFQAGREDGEPVGAAWMVRQATLPLRFFWRILWEKPDVVHINTALTDLSIWRDAALSRAAKLAGRPIVISLHGGRYLVDEFNGNGLESAAGSMLRAAKMVIVLSEAEKKAIETRWKGLDIRVLPNAVPVHDEPPSREGNGVPVIIFLGRLHESKGLDQIVKACTALKHDGCDFRFNCFGDGPIRESFLSRMRELLGGRFHYGGVVAGADKTRELERADIFLLPSLFGEGLPIAMLEAMAAGCVVVASEMASVATVIEDRVNGCLIAPGNSDQLIGRLKALLEDRTRWPAMRKAAFKTVRGRFGIEGQVKNLEEIYRAVVSDRVG